ncbi:hypothetical protein C1646_750698 [Rhizophagus diaphanus]|nr:hypothetical protein C1646_750698 [Rhizophagus diaphanus] [Rhizophagus sp. MUCL 43196]
MAYKCLHCSRTFATPSTLKRHISSKHQYGTNKSEEQSNISNEELYTSLETPTEKSSRKKAKKTGGETGVKKVSDMLEKFIELLSSETTQVQEVMEEGLGSFFDLYNAIAKKEEQAEIANRDVIKSYLVNEEVREQLPVSVSDETLRKRKEKVLKISYSVKSTII